MKKDHRRRTGKSVLLIDLVVDHDNTETRIKNLTIQNSFHQELENDRGHTLDHERQQIDKEHGRVTIKKQTIKSKNKTIIATNPNLKLFCRWLLI